MESLLTQAKSTQSPDPLKQGCCQDDDTRGSFHPTTPELTTPLMEDLQRELHQAACVGQSIVRDSPRSMDAKLISHARQRKSVEADALTWSLQALLTRHEAYVSEAEARRAADATTIDDLSTKTSTLEAENVRLQDENRELVAQAEGLNAALEESENRVKSLTATLRDTQNELARMRILGAKADRLEQQIVQVEMERQILQDTVIRSEGEERRANARWHASERALKSLETQFEDMELESHKAHEAQREIEARAERQKSIQNSIESHRKQAVQEAHAGDHNLLANFVKDILEDNAGLQLDMAELRDMLVRSQAETEDLRSQLTFASPLLTAKMGATHPAGLDLNTELQQHLALPPSAVTTPQPYSQQSSPNIGPRELHIHHHTHVAAPAIQPYTAAAPFSSSLPSTSRFTRPPPRHRRQYSSRSSIKTLHSRHESAASSLPSTVFESDGGYDTDFSHNTSITRPTSPESEDLPGIPPPLSMDEVLEAKPSRPPLRRRGSNESVLNVSGMDIHSPGSRSFRMPEITGGRPELARSHATATSVKGSAPGESAAGQALRERLQERERQRNKGGYNPVRDTFGGLWGAGRAKKSPPKARRVNAQVITEVVDEDGLRECLEEEEGRG